MYIKVIGTTGLGLAVLNILGFMKGVIMRKFNFRKILSLALAAFVAFGMLGVGTLGVNAEAENWFLDTNDTVWAGSPYWENGVSVYDMNNDGQDAKAITSATSSNNGVFSVKTESYDGSTRFYVNGVAKGTAKLTVTFTTPADETKTLSKNITVKKYPKEIKSLKVNGKKVKTSKYKYEYNKKLSKSKTKVKIKMALKKGWKVTSISAYRYTKNGDPKEFKVSKSAIKKGKNIKFSKKYYGMSISVEMKKGNDTINYSFYFYR